MRPVSLAVRRYLDEFSPAGLALAVSGGADSLALAACALDLASRRGVPTVTLTVDHGLREGSDREARQVADVLASMGAQSSMVLTGAVPTGSGPEGGARELRYRLLGLAAADFARQYDLARVDLLFGHTMNDQAETVLLRLARGAGSAALGGIRRRRSAGEDSLLHWGRPLLDVRREQTLACCEALGLDPVEDPTNRVDGPWRTADGQPLRRSAVRELALPELSRAVGQDVIPALARVAAQEQENEDALAAWARSVLEEARVGAGDGPGVGSGIAAGRIADAPAAVRKRALRLLALEVGVPGGSLAAVHLERLDALVSDWHGQGSVDLPGGIRMWRESGRLLWSGNSAH